jgi:hypothetical protein
MLLSGPVVDIYVYLLSFTITFIALFVLIQLVKILSEIVILRIFRPKFSFNEGQM